MKSIDAGLMVYVLINLSACQTTGDPGMGGLFGWDEGKTKNRQQALINKQERKKNDIARLKKNNKSLKKIESSNEDALLEINNTIIKLREEREYLKKQISQLRENNVISEVELGRLVLMYSWLGSKNRSAYANRENINDQDIALTKMRSMENDNKSLVSDILLLIGN